MLTTIELLERVKKSHENCSDYRAAKLLGVDRRTVSQWQKRGSSMEDETAIKAAELLNLNPEYVVACIHAERMKGRPSFALLARIASRIPPRAVAAGLAVLAIFCAAPSPGLFFA